jgi:murein DD-endopeptidase MepM/ murein hydrolase activator NlpD
VTLPNGETLKRDLAIRQREYEIQRIDGLPQEQVTPPQEVLDRIYAESALLEDTRSIDDPRTDFKNGFIWPVIGPITGVYGSQRVLNGEPRSPHYGIDIAAPTGTKVAAPADGVVTLAHPDMYFSGGTLVLDHGHGLSSSFVHLSRILVEKGERVHQGDVIAEVGATGRVTGPHLHWGMNLFDARIDPGLLMGPMPRAARPAQ